MSENKGATHEDSFVMVVDDDPFVLSAASIFLEEHGFKVIPCSDAAQALAEAQRRRIDAVLTDIRMPGLSGIELLEMIKSVQAGTPVILMTAYADMGTAIEAVRKGAFDFILKPFNPLQVIHAVEKALQFKRLTELEKNYRTELEETVRARTRELSDALLIIRELSNEIIFRLTKATEYRDGYTGAHIKRMSLYAARIGEVIGLSSDMIEALSFASPMHDLGKIGIPDRILLKHAHLTHNEFEVIKTHTTIGGKILAGSNHPKIQMAASIALNHHEKWDGTGYPRGLSGADIPIEARIVAVSDQYDALRSERPYKSAIGHLRACEILSSGDEKTKPQHFDPEILDAFIKVQDSFEEIFQSNGME